MAKTRLRFRVLFGGLLCTLIIAFFWGVSLLQNGSLLAPEAPCICPMEANQGLDTLQHITEGNFFLNEIFHIE